MHGDNDVAKWVGFDVAKWVEFDVAKWVEFDVAKWVEFDVVAKWVECYVAVGDVLFMFVYFSCLPFKLCVRVIIIKSFHSYLSIY